MRTIGTTLETDPLEGSIQDQHAQWDEQPPRIDTDYLFGLLSLALSFTLFFLTSEKIIFNSFRASFFILPYFIAILYTIRLMVNGKLRFFWKRQYIEYLHHRLLLCFVWLVSCFALNMSIPVFQPSAPWLSAVIVISGLTGTLFAWEDKIPAVLRNVMFFFIGASTTLWCYYAIYMGRLYLVSLPGLLFLGLSAHSFIPLMLCLSYLRLLYDKWNAYRFPILAGVISPLLFVGYFSIRWYLVSTDVRVKLNEIATRPTEDLPAWVMLGQILEEDWITKRFLIGKLGYQTIGESFGLFPTTLSDWSQHDPLVLIASLFTPKIDLSETEQTKLLDVFYDTRHDTQERLWSGSDLRTENVITQTRIYPDFRMAYTEKTISIASRASSPSWQEEALYTFYLPEGSVVSALSLWINGVEEKSYLTTQARADSAYKTIVGVESRDPSVVHWQEGNTVKVKVFPCTAKENRKFKIGITSPLRFDKQQLVYENIWFKGPAAVNATESIKLEFTKSVKDLALPSAVKQQKLNQFASTGKYKSSWEVRFDAPPVSGHIFTFDEKSYSAHSFQPLPEPFTAKAIYLDINQSWSKAEYDEVLVLVKNKPVYVYDEKLVRISNLNKEAILAALSTNNFSLFPVHLVPDRENALLITKANPVSPNLKDIKGSHFADALARDSDPFPLKTLLIGNEPSPYLKTLKELRVIRCEKTDWPGLKAMLSQNQFPQDPEKNPSTILIDNAGLLLREHAGTGRQKAPDHLLRLFAYNHIMKQIGGHYLDKSFQRDSVLNAKLIGEAEAAHIVTPVSSMVVLESQKDYGRFDIRKSKNSLDNATLKMNGAVPEPHEWALILLFALLVSWYTFKYYVR